MAGGVRLGVRREVGGLRGGGDDGDGGGGGCERSSGGGEGSKGEEKTETGCGNCIEGRAGASARVWVEAGWKYRIPKYKYTYTYNGGKRTELHSYRYGYP